jgi:hypothetical protein
MKYRKKPVIVEAIQFTEKTKDEVFNFIRCTKQGLYDKERNPIIIISTLEGEMKVELNDWVIRGIKGEFYPCKPDIFEKTYELVGDL